MNTFRINHLLFLLIAISLSACSNGQNKPENMSYKHTNDLINESSPYLLQHAHNPVNWHPWNKETLALAQKENKPIIVSIGYSSCHWCHVMEHQSFENEDVAKLMNDNFICIKVDREEHPDVDQIYMNAVQLITGSGGWPLNCFALPDGRPFYGGTYFNKNQWVSVLTQISDLYKNKHAEAIKYAQSIEEGIKKSEQIVKVESEIDFRLLDLKVILNNWETQMDFVEGGPNRAPKFPLPNNYKFLMRYSHTENDENIDQQVQLTLDKMANGGIYDQLGGGFARYSTDKLWKVPHFEKMLYDNAQLVSLYSDAYKKYKNEEYKRIVVETLEFINREMTNNDGVFFSALDADSDGEEGKFYVWKIFEIDSLLSTDANIFKDFYQMNDIGYWENDNYILMRTPTPIDIAKKYSISLEDLYSTIEKCKLILMQSRDKRIRPGLDDKSLLSWNAMMIEAYCDAYSSIGDSSYLNIATNAMDFILSNMQKPDGSFWHTYKNGHAKINAYLDDYALLIQALIKMSEVGAGNDYLYKANEISKLVIDKFYHKETSMFYYTSSDDEVLVSRKTEIFDNVIPSSNSIIASNLYKLYHYFDNEEYYNISKQMLNNVKDKFSNYGSSLSNWGILMMNFVTKNYELAISGENSNSILQSLNKEYFPNVIWVSDIDKNDKIGLLKDRFAEGKTLIYVCEGKQCKLPTDNVQTAIKLLRE
jgi:uncharacterized protein YyaL (SSP411 family)